MSGTERRREERSRAPRPLLTVLAAAALGGGGVALAADVAAPPERRVAAALKTRLPRTPVSRIDCTKASGLCEVTSGRNLFYVDASARYLVIGRVYDMATRQDLTAARLLEIDPDALIGGAAGASVSKPPAKAAPAGGPAEAAPALGTTAEAGGRRLALGRLPADGAIVWGDPAGPTLTVFTDLRCGYCRALASVLRSMAVRVVERPISVLGSRDLAERVYCARDRERALRAAYAGDPLPAGARCDTSGLDANERFARANGLTGTPVIVRADGAVLEGYRPREFLVDWLKGKRS